MVQILDQYNLSITLLITIGYQLIFFAVAYTLQTDKFTDFAGGTNFMILATVTFFATSEYDARQIIVYIFVMLWGFRLVSFLFYRILLTGSDTRFDDIRKGFVSFLLFFVSQMLWVWIVSLSFIFLNSPYYSQNTTSFGSSTDIVGIIIFVIGFALETEADITKQRFNKRRSGKYDIIRSGSWKYSRHPNYFGEILIWIGIFLLCVKPFNFAENSAGWASILSPIFIFTLLVFGSGLPIAEKSKEERFKESEYYDHYLDYINKVSPLIPLPNGFYSSLPRWLKLAFLELPIYRCKK